MARDLPRYTPRFNIAPETSPNIPVIIRQKGVNEWRLMHWGLIPHGAADPSIGNRMINARAETLTDLPSFKLLVDRRRMGFQLGPDFPKGCLCFFESSVSFAVRRSSLTVL